MADAVDVVVVGAGVMGCAIAWRLAEAGARVLVLERSVPGAEASSAAAGILGPGVEAHAPGVSLALGLRSLALHEALARRLFDEHGVDVGFRRCGVLVAAFDAEERDALAPRARWLAEAGVRHEHVDGAAARALEPALAPDVAGALVLPDEAQLEPRSLLRALALAAERAGARFRSGATVRSVRVEGARAVGVALDDGEVDAAHVVVAAGSWTTLVPGLRLAPGVIVPVRGQIVTTVTRPPIFRRVVFGAGGYVVTRPDGRVLVGSTLERVGFRREVTFAGLEGLLARARRLAPRLADAPVGASWSGFRPGTPDELPLVGPAGPDGLWLASGHFRNGILLAPVTAELVADLVLGRSPPGGLGPDALAALDPRRFAPPVGAMA